MLSLPTENPSGFQKLKTLVEVRSQQSLHYLRANAGKFSSRRWPSIINVTHDGFLSIFHGTVRKPLMLWEKKVRNGQIKRIADNEIQAQVLEIIGNRLNSTYITCPKETRKILGIQFPYLNMTVKNLNRLFAFDVQVLDDKDVRRRFRISTFFSAAEETIKKIYGTNYLETLRLQIYSNCRLYRIYFTDKAYKEEELPQEFRLYQPASQRRTSVKVPIRSF